jgi:hypothetical protein
MRNLSTSALSPRSPHQLSILFDSPMLRGMSPSERRTLLARLASLLLEAAGVATAEVHDDEH